MHHNDGRWWQDRNGDWYHPEQGVWRLTTSGEWIQLAAGQSSGIGRALVWIVGLGLLFGGCTLIVSEPVVSLAIVFVGIPFVVIVVWLMSVLMPAKR